MNVTAPFRTQGFGVICRLDGRIERFVRDDLHLAEQYCGRPFKDLLDSASRAKAQAFLDAVRFTGAAFDWELDVLVGVIPRTLHFVGGSTGEQYLICGIQSRQDVLPYLEELAGINNEQLVLVRDAVKQMLTTRTQRLMDGGVYDEMSRLNNELVNAKRELQKQTSELSRLNEEKNRALGVVAHDLRNPISVLHMFSEYLLVALEDRLRDDEREMLRTMRQTADSMGRLVHDVLDVSAIEAGRLALDMTPVDVAPFLGSLVSRLGLIARKAGVELRLETSDAADLQVRADPGKLEQVMNNLIDNAIKFSPAGEQVRLRAFPEDAHVVIRVSDCGPGISAEARANLFRPFTPADVGPNGRPRGTGLGLSIAKRIVDGHGGRIEVESTPGEGACFQVTLPVSRTGAAPPLAASVG